MARLIIRALGRTDYAACWRAMRAFTARRTPDSDDEIWFTEHDPVYTIGLKDSAHSLAAPSSAIPLIRTDRGGRITYHGPGQLILYPLIDLRRVKLGVRSLISALENSTIRLLAQYGIEAYARADAPGVYILRANGRKIASLGLKVRKQGSYHGIALNVDMDLAPFRAIAPCGLTDIQMTDLAQERKKPLARSEWTKLQKRWMDALLNELPVDYDEIRWARKEADAISYPCCGDESRM